MTEPQEKYGKTAAWIATVIFIIIMLLVGAVIIGSLIKLLAWLYS